MMKFFKFLKRKGQKRFFVTVFHFSINFLVSSFRIFKTKKKRSSVFDLWLRFVAREKALASLSL